MPPRLLISATASCALEMALGPQTPGEPVQQMKAPTRSRLLAPRRRNEARSLGDITRPAGDDRFLSSMDGGNAGPPRTGTSTVECTPAPVWHRHLQRATGPSPFRIEFWSGTTF